MVEIGKLTVGAILLATVAAITLVLIAIVIQYGIVLREDTTVAVTGLTLGATNVSTAVGTTGQYPYLQDLDSCFNSTNAVALIKNSDYIINEGNDNGGSVTVLQAGEGRFNAADINCTTLQYLADTDSQAVASTFVSGLTIFGTFAGVIALAIIGMVIIQLFSKGEK